MKAQSSLEYLMTYGIAIMMVLGILGMLMYAGVIDISKNFPEKTIFLYPIPNVDDAIIYKNGTIKIMLVNNLDVNITMVGDGYGGTGDFNPTGIYYNETNIEPNEKFIVKFYSPINRSRVKGFLRFRYINDYNNKIHNQSGYIAGNAE